MENKRLKINIKTIILIISIIIFSCLSVITFAWFTDKESYSGTLNFGNIKLKVSGGVEGNGTDSATSKLVFNTARKKNNDPTWTGNFMPGDLVEINLTVGLEENSEPAYYIVSIQDTKNVFENAFYYSQNGIDVYVNNGKKVVKQNTTIEETSKKVGMLTAGDSNAHNLTISAKIDEKFAEQGVETVVYCNIFAIQQANLDETLALTKMLLNSSTDVSKKIYTQVEYLESSGSQRITTDYYIDGTSDWTMEYSVKWKENNTRELIGFNLANGWWGINEGNYQAVGSRKTQMPASTTAFDKIKLVSTNKVINMYVNDTLTYTINYSNGVGHLKLFALYNDGDSASYYNNCQMTTISVKEGDLVIHNLVPAVRNQDNKPGMLDTVCGRFYTNEGTGEFVYG